MDGELQVFKPQFTHSVTGHVHKNTVSQGRGNTHKSKWDPLIFFDLKPSIEFTKTSEHQLAENSQNYQALSQKVQASSLDRVKKRGNLGM